MFTLPTCHILPAHSLFITLPSCPVPVAQSRFVRYDKCQIGVDIYLLLWKGDDRFSTTTTTKASTGAVADFRYSCIFPCSNSPPDDRANWNSKKSVRLTFYSSPNRSTPELTAPPSFQLPSPSLRLIDSLSPLQFKNNDVTITIEN